MNQAALTRLALSDRARDLVDEAMQLVPTLDDDPGSATRHLAQALRVRAEAGRVVGAAILSARLQGMDWAEIALSVGIRTGSVQDRWQPEEEAWRVILRRARDSLPPEPNDPDVVYAADDYAADLDAWALRHLDPLCLERWDEEGKDPTRPVSGGLPLVPGARADPEPR